MKKIIFPLIIIYGFLFPTSGYASTNETHPPTTRASNISKADEAKILVQRLNEIYDMDKSTLTRKEKRALRQEVRSIDKKLHTHYGGVYISAAGLIIIILLLLILL